MSEPSSPVAPLPTVTRPKRPLSSFNLYYRFKRKKALEAIANGMLEKERIAELVVAPPGAEHAASLAGSDEPDETRRQNIRRDLENDLHPRDTRKRVHRINSSAMNGTISFIELIRLMNNSWKECDPFARGVFNELAKEGLEQYRGKMEQYKAYLALKKIAGRKEAAATLAASPQARSLNSMSKPCSPVAQEGEALPTVRTKPKPLSSFILFYGYKRKKAFEAIANGTTEKERIAELVMAPPGTEHYPSSATTLDETRRQNIIKDLEHDRLPRDTSDRVHQTNPAAMNGAISFLELSRLMNISWKECDPFARSVFDDVAKEGLEQYRGRMEQYNASLAMKKVAGRKEAAAALSAFAAAVVYGKRPPKEDPSRSQPSSNSSRGGRPGDVYPEANRATAGGYLSDMSNDRPHCFEQQQRQHQQKQQHQHPSYHIQQSSRLSSQLNNNDTEASLRARLRQLEYKLAAERLRSRVKELEDQIARSRAEDVKS